jgi:hypothetical protein
VLGAADYYYNENYCQDYIWALRDSFNEDNHGASIMGELFVFPVSISRILLTIILSTSLNITSLYVRSRNFGHPFVIITEQQHTSDNQVFKNESGIIDEDDL